MDAFRFIASSSEPERSERRLYLINTASIRPGEVAHFNERFKKLIHTISDANKFGEYRWDFRVQWSKHNDPTVINDLWLLPNGDALGVAIDQLRDDGNYLILKSLVEHEEQDIVFPMIPIGTPIPEHAFIASVRFDTPRDMDLPDEALDQLIHAASLEGDWQVVANGVHFTGYPGRWLIIWSVPDEAALNDVRTVFEQQFKSWHLDIDYGPRVVVP